MVTAVIQQPTFLPWMGYFEQISRCDVFVFLDSVQFERHSWQNRNRLRTVAGVPFWLTAPVEHAPLHTLIKDIRLLRSDQTWVRKHAGSLRASLGKSEYFHRYHDLVEQWLAHDVLLLADLNIALITDLARIIGFNPTFVRSSDLGVAGAKSELVLEICQRVNATRYYSPAGSKVYLEEEIFAAAGMSLEYQTWAHPTYPQCGKGFVSHLSIVDALMNLGPDETRRLIDCK